MKPGGGKAKGAAFERKVCQKLSRFVLPDSDETLFWRTAMSGGRATIRRRVGKKDSSQDADITCIHQAGAWLTEKFIVECKFLKNLQIQGGLIHGTGGLVAFWDIVEELGRQREKHPILIAKENNEDTLLLISRKGLHSMVTFRRIKATPILWSEVMHALVFKFDDFLGA